MTLTSQDELRAHCRRMIDYMAGGAVIPFFGAGINLSNRPPQASFIPGQYLPNAAELSASIAARFNYPFADTTNLSHVSWYAKSIAGRSGLYRYLHEIFSPDYPLTAVHRFFARLPATLAAKGYADRHQLIFTTNYDQLLERAFTEANEPYDLLFYVAHSEDMREVGRFKYVPHGGERQIIFDPTLFDLPMERTIILKIHGSVETNWEDSSFVISEDDYIDYLARMNTDSYRIPSVVMEKMMQRSFLFLGYSLMDWDLRILHNLNVFGGDPWAIMKQTDEWQMAYWRAHSVQFKQLSLSDYLDALSEELDALPVIG
jgi:hypothetical protein